MSERVEEGEEGEEEKDDEDEEADEDEDDRLRRPRMNGSSHVPPRTGKLAANVVQIAGPSVDPSLDVSVE